MLHLWYFYTSLAYLFLLMMCRTVINTIVVLQHSWFM